MEEGLTIVLQPVGCYDDDEFKKYYKGIEELLFKEFNEYINSIHKDRLELIFDIAVKEDWTLMENYMTTYEEITSVSIDMGIHDTVSELLENLQLKFLLFITLCDRIKKIQPEALDKGSYLLAQISIFIFRCKTMEE